MALCRGARAVAAACAVALTGIGCQVERPHGEEKNPMTTITLQPRAGDNTPALCEALRKLGRSGGGTLRLAPGRYRCCGGNANPDGRTRAPSITLADAHDMTIDGTGATLVGTDIAGLFRFSGVRNLTVRGLTVDWDPLPHTSGRVTAVDAQGHSFDLQPLIPERPQAGRIVQAVLAYDPSRRRLADSGWELYQTQGECDATPMQATTGGQVRVFLRRDMAPPAVGSHVIVRHQVYGHDAFVFQGCTNVLMENVTVHAVPGMAVIGWDSRDLTVRHLAVVPSDGGWMSATADAMHFGACRGTVVVEDSTFAGMGDDAINIHGMYGLVTARVDDRTIAVARARLHPYYDKVRTAWDTPAAGDVLEYGGGAEPLLARGRLTVAESQVDGLSGRTLVKVEGCLPADVGEGTVLANLSTAPSVRIRRCQVRGNRARGLLLQSRDVVVEDCGFEDVSGAGIQVCADGGDWWECLGARDVRITGCTFRRCNYGVARRVAALDIFSDLRQGRQSAAGVHQGLCVSNNTFEANAGAAIGVGSADGVEVSGNRIVCPKPPAIVIDNSRNVVVRGNSLPTSPDVVAITGTSERTSIKVSLP